MYIRFSLIGHTMFHLLYKYLVFHQQLHVPGIGAFTMSEQSAEIISDNDTIQPPLQSVSFSPNTDVENKDLYDFLAAQLRTNTQEAAQQFEEFCRRLKQEVSEKKWVDLPGLGTFTQGVNDEVKFKPAHIAKEYYPDIVAKPEFRSDAQHKIMVGDQERTTSEMQSMLNRGSGDKKKEWWWISAIILFLIGAGAIAYYYLVFDI